MIKGIPLAIDITVAMGLAAASGRYILFLNSDIIVENVNFSDLVYYMDKNKNVGILTISVVLENGQLDMASHRGFPTVWNSFTYFTRLEKIFSKIPKLSKYFGGYHMTHLSLNSIHEIDSPSGAFYFTRKDIMDKVGGFDTRFFMYGEDLDLSFRIRKLGFIAVYYPLFKVIHLKYKSGLKRGLQKTESKTKSHFYDAMKIFYDKHFAQNSNPLKNRFVHFFIDVKSKFSK
jgi:GT2 family glycosyltransferase